MANNYNVPPRFDEKRSYESWKNELGIWTRVTNLDAKKQALAVVLSLEGRARDTALEISVEDLNNDDGMGTLIRALDSVFLKEEKDAAYEAYSNFDSVSRDISVAMTDYIIDFEQRYNRMRKYDMVLPDAVLAFKLLDTACLDGREKQLALTACTVLTFASMKSALKIIFGEKTSVAPLTDGMQASDGAYYTEQQRKGAKKSRSQDNLKRAPFPGTNPLDKYERRSKCAVCQSTYHWVKDCPHKNEQVKLTEENVNTDIEQCNITLFSNESASDTEICIVESLGSAVIDTACTRTVCGAKWLDSYVSELNMKEVQNMIDIPSNRAFKFGDGRIVHSTKRVKIPAKIGQTKCHIETEVVPTDIPLLLSKASLKKAGAVLDIKNDKAVMFKQPVTLELTTSGHYCVNILDKDITQSPCKNEIRTDMEILTVTDNMNTKEKHKVLLKLHKQFGHATVDRLQKLLSSSGNNDDESISILQQIVNNCETCQKYVDLHELAPSVWYLHIIDHFTRFSAGSIVNTKKPSDIVRHFMHSWVSVHGPPQKLYSDNGGEFNNNEIREMAEKFNMEVKTTAAYSPWSNGLLERHNQTLTEIMLKVKQDNGCDWNTALDWALMAKNSMHNVHGYSPYQLVFGQNPNLPSVLVDKPPALEGASVRCMGGTAPVSTTCSEKSVH
ncbi:uncharacterized protein isoform X1 [Salmo salar]|uniref:Uncharacterized protein LOC106602727 n=1 Tax=Salmo salar TaxID=8030 RepID=A0A1S3RFD7_SALSA|nr:uncharacterized protein LOC106602727 isoform X1 [Salmo salar]XP_014051021.1 uncharacterized protein LOC106602727 isoform X1 [Salmo salar]XP_045572742.1 uncharacterized protein LOC106602727 isoform X1 [Salmo salar]|eukprot:XP_014051020.1 PREDICTED: uncharacterized protein LOC106602727 [Salmo salar]